MTSVVAKIVDDVKQLDKAELDELLAWLAEYELSQMDAWDREIERDSRPGGRLGKLVERARRDISEGRTRPLDEVLNNP